MSNRWVCKQFHSSVLKRRIAVLLVDDSIPSGTFIFWFLGRGRGRGFYRQTLENIFILTRGDEVDIWAFGGGGADEGKEK